MNPCIDCDKRTPTCHGECELYLKWCEEVNEIQKKMRKSAERKHNDYFYHK